MRSVRVRFINLRTICFSPTTRLSTPRASLPFCSRELGTRQLSDVPRSEVAELIRLLNLEGSSADVVKRAVLNAYGLVRLTPKTSLYLDECLSYRWRE